MIKSIFSAKAYYSKSKYAAVLILSVIFSNYLIAQDASNALQEKFFDAVFDGSFEEAGTLIKEGLDVDVRDDQGETALLKAVREGEYDAVKFLVEHNADVNTYNSEGYSYENHSGFWLRSSFKFDPKRNPVMRAAYFEHYEIFKYLLNNGAEMNSEIIYSAIAGGINYVSFLTEEKNFPYQEMISQDKGYSLLRTAVNNNNIEMINYLVKLGCDVNSSGKSDHPLISSVAYSDEIPPDVLKCLISHGADVHVAASRKASMLIEATYSKNIEKVKLIHEQGVDIHARDMDGQTALIVAAAYGNFEIVKYLVENGSDVDATDIYGYTPLARAAGSQGVIDPGSKGVFTHNGNLEMVKYLVGKGADFNTLSNNGESLLMHAAWKGNLELVRYLVNDLKIDPKFRTSGKPYPGSTAIDYAKKREHKEVVEFLSSVK